MTSRTPLDLSTSVRIELSEHFLVWQPVQRGPFSTVFSAHDARGGQRVLLHVVLRSALDRAGLTRRFHGALAAWAALEHPGIVRVLASGSSANFEWYTTQPAGQRTSLSSILNDRGPVTGDALIKVVEQVAAVLRYAHNAGVPHGHLSPSTVFANDEGQIRVSEFCTRRILYLLRGNQNGAGTREGDAGLAATPEQLMRHDRLSLALLIHECLAGQALATTGIESGATGQGGQMPTLSDAFSDLEKRALARGPLPESEATALNQLFSTISDDHPTLPTVTSIAAELGFEARHEPEDEVPSVAVPMLNEDTDSELPAGVPLVFPSQPEPPRRQWSLIAAVAIATSTLWLALFQVPRVTRPTAPVGRTAAASDPTVAHGGLSPGTLAAAEVAPPAQPAAPEGKEDSSKSAQRAISGSQSAARGLTDTVPPRPVRTDSVRTGSATEKAANPAKTARAATDSAKVPVQVTPGTVFISTRPWGYLYLDGAMVGNTPMDVSVSAGVHRLRVVRDGFQPFESEVTVLPGQRLRLIDIILVRRNP